MTNRLIELERELRNTRLQRSAKNVSLGRSARAPAGLLHRLTGNAPVEGARALDYVVPNQPPSNPGAFSLLRTGLLTANTTIEVQGGQAMWFHFENQNVLGVQFTVTSQDKQSAPVSLLPMASGDFVFTCFGNEPMGWTFEIRFTSSARVVTYELKSTWVPGNQPNPPPSS